MNKFLTSKTLWFNQLLAALGLILAYGESQFPLLRDYLPPDQYGLFLFGTGVIGYTLRLVTNAPITSPK